MIIVIGGFSKKYVFIIFRSSCMQMFFKTIVARNFAIFAGKHLCWSLFSIKNNFISTFCYKRLQHSWFLFCENCEIFMNTFFYGTCLVAVFVSLIKNCSMMDICRFSLLNQKQYVGWFLLKKFVDLVRVCYVHVISRNHSSMLSLINLQKRKTCPKEVLQQRLFVVVLGFWQFR